MSVKALILPIKDVSAIWGKLPSARTGMQLAKAGIETGQMVGEDTLMLLRSDVIYEDAVLNGLSAQQNCLLTNENGERLAALGDAAQRQAMEDWLNNKNDALPDFTIVTPATAGFAYNRSLRKRATPQCYVVNNDNAYAIEWALYKTSYKGVTDFVTKYVWPVPAFHVTRFCARFHISPNTVTSLSAVLMIAALVLFWQGHYGTGLLAGWCMTFLDTVDGKLARCTLTSSKWGNIFDHGIDLIHPPFWYIAWGIGLIPEGTYANPALVAGLMAMFISYVLGRLCEGYFIRRFGFHIHVWRRGDSLFRMVVARRNPNLLILTLCWMAGRPDIGLLLVILWTVAAVPVHLWQIAQAGKARKNGQVLTSWLST